MANNNYELEEMENAAIKKSGNWKKGVAVGAGVLAAGGAVAYGATRINDIHGTEPEDEADDQLNTDDLEAGAETSGVEQTDLNISNSSTHTERQEIHVYHHNDDSQEEEKPVDGDPEFTESGIVYDEEGNVVGTYDAGKYSDRDFMLVDDNGDGVADRLAWDANKDGKYQANEIKDISEHQVLTGNSDHRVAYMTDDEGNIVKVYDSQENPIAYVNGEHETDPIHPEHNNGRIDDIRNDFRDERTGEEYDKDLAENNPDYRNHEPVDYGAQEEHEDTDHHAGYDHNGIETEEEYTENYNGMPSPEAGYDDRAEYDDHSGYEDHAEYDDNNGYAEVDGTYTDPEDDLADHVDFSEPADDYTV